MADVLEAFLHAALLGRADVIDSCISTAQELNVDLTQRGPEGKGAMQIACEAGNVDAVRMLLKHNFVLGATGSANPYDTLSPAVMNVFQLELFQLVAQGQTDRVMSFIDSKMDPRAEINGDSLLQWANHFERDDLALLLEDRIRVEPVVPFAATPFVTVAEDARPNGALSPDAEDEMVRPRRKSAATELPRAFTQLKLAIWPPLQTGFATPYTFPLPPAGPVLGRLSECTIDAPSSCMSYMMPLGTAPRAAYIFADDIRAPDITLRLSPLVDGFKVVVSPSRAEIVGDSEASLKLGCKTLRALESDMSLRESLIIAKDRPASKLRGLYMDVGRLPEDGHFCRYAVLKCAENWHITHIFYPLGATPVDTAGFSLLFVPVLFLSPTEPFVLDNSTRDAVSQSARGEAHPGRVMLGLRPSPGFTTTSLVACVLDVHLRFHRPPLIVLFLDQCVELLDDELFYPAFLCHGVSDCIFVTDQENVYGLEHWGFTTCLFTPSSSSSMPPYVMPHRERIAATGHPGRIIQVDISETFCGFESEICVYSLLRAAGDLWNLDYEWSISMMEVVLGDTAISHSRMLQWLWGEVSPSCTLSAVRSLLRMEAMTVSEEELKNLYGHAQRRSVRLQEIEQESDLADNQILERMAAVAGLCLEWIKWCCRAGLLLVRYAGGFNIANFNRLPPEKRVDVQNLYLKLKEKSGQYHKKWGEAPWPEQNALEEALEIPKEGSWSLRSMVSGTRFNRVTL